MIGPDQPLRVPERRAGDPARATGGRHGHAPAWTATEQVRRPGDGTLDFVPASERWKRPPGHDRTGWGTPDVRPVDGEQWDCEAKGLFFLAVNAELPMSFVQALTAIGYRPVPLSGEAGEKVDDIAIQRTLEELSAREADVVLVSNDGDFDLEQSDTVSRLRRCPTGDSTAIQVVPRAGQLAACGRPTV